jgi:ribosomal protein S18 acetylase RimI-like enzyme
MESAYVIRLARPTLADAAALLDVEHESLGDSPYSPERVQALLARPEHRAYLAVLPAAEGGEEVVGFCSTFETPTANGPRLEIDMLGVRPAHRGRGLATRLIRSAIRAAWCREVGACRGVVAEENVASQRAFGAAGLAVDPRPCDLLVYPIGGTSPLELPGGLHYARLEAGTVSTPDGAEPPFDATPERPVHLVSDLAGRTVALAASLHVRTLSYEGLWIERLWAADDLALRAAIRAVVEEAKRLDLDEVGHLAAIDPERGGVPALDAWLREGYLSMGRYLVYTLHLAPEGRHLAPGSSSPAQT